MRRETEMDIQKFLCSPVMREAMQILEDGVVMQFQIDDDSFTVEKKDGKVESARSVPSRPFLIFAATSKALESLAEAKDSLEWGRRFGTCFLDQSVKIKLMAPPGTALTYGIPVMFNRLGIRPNLIGGERT
jgi:hypothetical protein